MNPTKIWANVIIRQFGGQEIRMFNKHEKMLKFNQRNAR